MPPFKIKLRTGKRTAFRLAMVVAVGGFISAYQIANPTPSHADFGSTVCGGNPVNCVSLANNRYHATYKDGSFGSGNNDYDVPAMGTALAHRLDYSYSDATVLSAYVDQGDPYPDVVTADYNWGSNNPVGWVFCPSYNTGTGGSHPYRWCRGQRMFFNSHYHKTGLLSSWQARHHLACHELGHTLGLRHSGNAASCLWGGSWNYTPRFLSQYEIDRINERY